MYKAQLVRTAVAVAATVFLLCVSVASGCLLEALADTDVYIAIDMALLMFGVIAPYAGAFAIWAFRDKWIDGWGESDGQ